MSRALRNGVLLLVAGTLVALTAEGAIRLRAWLKYGYTFAVESTFEVDARTGLRTPIPGARLGPISHSSLGFRSPEIPVPKPPGRLRLAFLGGSTTYCAEVSSDEATWPHLVWEAVRRALPGLDVDYVNGGVPGYGVTHSHENLRQRIAPLEPDLVVVYHASNDLSGNTFVLAQQQGLVERRPAAEESWLSQYSLFVHLVEKNLEILYRQKHAHEPMGKLRIDRERLAATFHDDLAALVDEATSHGQLVVLVTFATRMRREQSPAERAAAGVSSFYYMPYMSADGLLEGFELYNEVIREVARSRGAILVEGTDAVPGDGAHFQDSVHFTDAGARVFAERVAGVLLAAPEFIGLADARRK